MTINYLLFFLLIKDLIKMSNLTVFNNDGLEIVINTVTGESFATQAGYVRMSGKAQSTISERMTTIGNSENNHIKLAEVLTQQGLRSHRLIPATIVFEWLLKDNPELAKKMGEAGATIYLQRIAGYEKPKAPQTLLEALELAVNLERDKVKLLEENKLLNLHNSSLKVEVNELNEINEELNEFKDDVNGYEKFIELLDITKNEIKSDEYLEGTTITQFLINWNNDINRFNEKVDQDYWKTINKRASMYYRLLEGKIPTKNNKSQYVFFGKKVAYIIATIKLVNQGI